MKSLKHLSILFLLSILSSCSTGTGGIIGNLIPAPKTLDGEVIGGTYYSPENAFSVKLPHPPGGDKRDNYEWQYTKIHEIKDTSVIGIVLGPAAFDKNGYHAVLIREKSTPNNEPMKEYAKTLFDRKAKGRNRNLELKHYSKSLKNNKDFYYGVYAGENSYLVLSLTDNKGSFHVVEADIFEDSNFDGFQSLDQIIERKWSLFNTMVNSFTIINDEYKP